MVKGNRDIAGSACAMASPQPLCSLHIEVLGMRHIELLH